MPVTSANPVPTARPIARQGLKGVKTLPNSTLSAGKPSQTVTKTKVIAKLRAGASVPRRPACRGGVITQWMRLPIRRRRPRSPDPPPRPDPPMDYALTTALPHVPGHDPISRDTLRAELDALTADDVRLGAATIRDHAILAVPEPTTPQLPGLPRLPESTSIPVHGRAFRPRLCARLPLRSRLIIGDDGVSMLLRGRAPLTVRYDEVTGLVHGARGYCDLASADGTTIALDANQWRGGPIALATVSAAIPQHLQVPHYPG